MKKLLVFLLLSISITSFEQRIYPTKIQGLNALFYVPNIDTTQPVNVLLFTPGAGEQGADIRQLYVHGPFQFLKAGVDIGANIVVCAIQNINPNPQPNEYQLYIDGIKKLYKVNKIVLTGLSRGGQNAEWYANSSEARLAGIAGILVFSSQGTVSDYPGIPGTLNPSLYLKYNIPIWRGEGDQDFTWDINNNANKLLGATAPRLASMTVWPGAGHGDPVWSQGYDPFPTGSSPLFVAMKMSSYQWAASVMGAPTTPPIVVTYKSAGASQSYMRNNCGCGVPSPVVYAVPAGKYTSTVSQAAADQLAMSDLQANGQANANTTGTCAPIVVASFDVLSDGTIIKR